MIDLVFGLHLYQPPNQTLEILKKIAEESYLPVIDLILSHPRARFTVDIAKSAAENLAKCGEGKEFMKNLQKAVDLRKIALANTAAYHPILPLLSEREIKRQIVLNEMAYSDLFGHSPAGLFPPEMAYSQKIIPVLEKLGYKWTITADTPFVCLHNHNPDPPFDWITGQGEIAVFLRSDFWSTQIAFNHATGKNFANDLRKELKKWFGRKRGYLIIWLDWETFGHHRKNFIKSFLGPLLDNLDNDISLCSPSDLLAIYPQKRSEVPPGSWSTNAQDFWYKNYWPLWNSPHIEFHRLWWELVKIILKIKENVRSEEQLSVFDKAAYSCQTWQYSQGNKELAKSGLIYFKKIQEMESAVPFRQEISQIIERLEYL